MMHKIVKQAIDVYNQYRPHISCDLLTPNQMHQKKESRNQLKKRKLAVRKILLLKIIIYFYKSVNLFQDETDIFD